MADLPSTRAAIRAATLILATLVVAFSIGIGLPGIAAADDTADRSERIAALSRAIDDALAARWQSADVVPAEPSNDGEFLRRAYLDLAGRIPPVSVARKFLADESADKRARMIAELLDSPTYVANFATVWRSVLLPELDTDNNLRFQSSPFDTWLVRQFAGNAGYDEIARELLTLPLGADLRVPSGAAVFYQAKEFKPENIAGGVARAFLGLRIECAQCHDHPFARWKQDDFWGMAAFFIRTQRSAQGNGSPAAVDIKIPDTDRVVSARLPGHSEPALVKDADPRAMLADWMTRDNPYFARAAVNRIWAHLFGTGLVDPVDDFDESNPPSHPELLEHLAKEFAASGYDLKFVLAAICHSRAYQLSSACSDPSQKDPRLFARAVPRALSPNQLYESLIGIGGRQEEGPPPPAQPLSATSEGQELMELFGLAEVGAAERALSVPQALSMMNGGLVADATSPIHGALVAALADFPGMTTRERVETLYLATLTRRPTSQELKPLVEYVDDGGTEGEEAFALCDVLWALVNSSEFLVNH